MSLFDIARYFLIYSFLGWIVEVIYHVIKQHHIINRGFLTGPVCPVYGFGMIAILYFKQYISVNMSVEAEQLGIIPTFLIGVIFCSLVEFIAGWLLDFFFHARWWDYRKEKWNINGYVCPKFSILWGIGVVFLIYVVQPLFGKVPVVEEHYTFYWVILGVCYAIYLVDFILTFFIMIGLNKKLNEINKLQDQLALFSDNLTIAIGDASLTAMATAEKAELKTEQIKDSVQETVEEVREESRQKITQGQEELSERFRKLHDTVFQQNSFTVRRILKAFPTITSHSHFELLEELKNFYQNREKEEK